MTHEHQLAGMDAGRLWGGGLATAAVAALTAFVGILIMSGVFGIRLLGPHSRGVFTESATSAYVVFAGMGALAATLLLQVLVAVSPTPIGFFSWIVGLVTVVFAVIPLTENAPLSSQLATSLINLFIGLVIVTLLPQIGYSAMTAREVIEE